MTVKKRIAALFMVFVLTASALLLSACGDDDDKDSIGNDLNVELSEDDEGWSPVWKP